MGDNHNVYNEPSDGSENWVEYRRLLLSEIRDLKEGQKSLTADVHKINEYIAGQKAVVALMSLLFGTLGAVVVSLFKKGAT